MNCPAAVLAAISQLGPIPCSSMCGVVEVGYDNEHDRLIIRHPYAACEYVTDPAGPAATELAWAVIDDLSRLVQLADYGTECVNEWAVTA